MKNKLYLLFIIFISFIFLVSCGNKNNNEDPVNPVEPIEHEHIYDTVCVSYDDDYHYFKSICHPDVKKREAHQFDGEWKIIEEATEEKSGLKRNTCKTCMNTITLYIPPIYHTHTYETEWSYDDNTHFHKATCQHIDEKKDVAEHDFVNGVCSICKYENKLVGLNFTLNSDKKSYTVSAFASEIKDNVVIPASYKGLPVIEIEEYGFRNCLNLKHLTIPSSIKKINAAFNNCEKLENIYYEGTIEDWCKISFYNYIWCNYEKYYSQPMVYASHFYLRNNNQEWEEVTSIEIPEGVIEIGVCQFYGFGNVTSITIPNSVTSIGYEAFENCSITKATLPTTAISSIPESNLKEVIITGGESIGDRAFSSCRSLLNVYSEGTIEDWCKIKFYNSSSNPMAYASHFYLRNNNQEWEEVTSIEVPEGVIEIGNYQFCGFNNITSITIPDSVTSIGDRAFSSCRSLTSIEIPDSVTSIGSLAFSSCSSLTSIEIPNSVTSIGNDAFSDCRSIAKATLPTIAISSISKTNLKEVIITGGESIGSSAFESCRSLTSIEIPDSVTSIGNDAFYNCSSLTSIEIPNSVTSIGSLAFYNCSSLTSIEIPDSVTSIGDRAFADCSNLTSLVIGNSVTSIGKYAFSDCSNLTSLVIGNSVTSIGKYAFSDCRSIAKATLPTIAISSIPKSNLKEVIITGGESIGSSAFSSCSNLTSIEIPDSVTSIGNDAFYNCSSLTSIEIPNSVTSIGNFAFKDCRNLTSLVIGNSVTSIGSSAFESCRSLTSIEIPDSVTSIGNDAFYNCSSLTSIEIPNSVTSIGSLAFYNCYRLVEVYNLSNLNITIGSSDNGGIGEYAKVIHTSLEEKSRLIEKENYVFIKDDNNVYYLVSYKGTETDLELPDNIEGNNYEINQYAFRDCSNPTSIVIPNSVTSIGEYAFNDCSNLTSIEIPDSVTSIGKRAFESCSSLTSIEIPDSVTSIGEYAFNDCSRLQYKEYDNGLYLGNIDNPYLWLIQAKHRSITECKINENTKFICSYSFNECSSLISVVIGNSVTNIKSNAFYSCYRLVEVYNLSNLIITAGSSSNGRIGEYAKVIHTSLEEKSRLIEKDNYVFIKDNDNKYYLVSYKGKETKLVLPDNIEGNKYEIYQYAFNDCSNLTSIVIGNSVTSIGEYAFSDCRKLKEVYYKGTKTDWEHINIGFLNSILTNVSRYYYSETEPTTTGNYWHYVDGVPTKW